MLFEGLKYVQYAGIHNKIKLIITSSVKTRDNLGLLKNRSSFSPFLKRNKIKMINKSMKIQFILENHPFIFLEN